MHFTELKQAMTANPSHLCCKTSGRQRQDIGRRVLFQQLGSLTWCPGCPSTANRFETCGEGERGNVRAACTYHNIKPWYVMYIYISYLYTWILCTSNYSVFFLFFSSTFRLRSLFGIPFFSTLEHLGCVASHRLGPDLRRLRCGRASHLPRKREAWPGQLHTIRGRVMMWDEY